MNVKETLTDKYWINMQEELAEIEINKVWELVPKLESADIIGTDWIYKNKSDETGNMTTNKTRLVSQGYT